MTENREIEKGANLIILSNQLLTMKPSIHHQPSRFTLLDTYSIVYSCVFITNTFFKEEFYSHLLSKEADSDSSTPQYKAS
jgi:hypothetical protein